MSCGVRISVSIVRASSTMAVVMTAAYAFMVFAAMVVYAVLADRVRTFLAKGRGPQLINRASGAIFVLMALFVGINAVSAFV